MRSIRQVLSGVAAVSLAMQTVACGTTYQVPQIAPADLVAAESVIVAERQRSAAQIPLANTELISLYGDVVGRIEPVAETFCAELTEPGTNCDFDIRIFPDPAAPANAFQAYDDNGKPQLMMTLSFLDLVREPDELAFVIGHEAGHHIADHINKQRQQAAATAIALGILTAVLLGAAGAYGGYNNPYQDFQNQQTIGNMMQVGSAIGGQAYSQTYELEADMLGAYIAEAAGFDPVAGSLIFPRLAVRDGEAPPADMASFWATHPSSPERIALVSAAASEIRAQRDAGVRPFPTEKPQEEAAVVADSF